MHNYSTTIFTKNIPELDTDRFNDWSDNFDDIKNYLVRISEISSMNIKHFEDCFKLPRSFPKSEEITTISLKNIQNYIDIEICNKMYYMYGGCCKWGKNNLHVLKISNLRDAIFHIYYIVENSKGVIEYVYDGDANVQLGDAGVETHSNDDEIVIYNSGNVESVVQIKRE